MTARTDYFDRLEYWHYNCNWHCENCPLKHRIECWLFDTYPQTAPIYTEGEEV